MDWSRPPKKIQPIIVRPEGVDPSVGMLLYSPVAVSAWAFLWVAAWPTMFKDGGGYIFAIIFIFLPLFISMFAGAVGAVCALATLGLRSWRHLALAFIGVVLAFNMMFGGLLPAA